MTVTIQSVNATGAGIQFTFAAAGDSYIILPGVTVASTTASAINFAGFSSLAFDIGGTLVSRGLTASGAATNINIGEHGRFVSTEANSANAAVFLFNADGCTFQNSGELLEEQSIAILTIGGSMIVNSGRISGSSGVFLGLSGGGGDTLLNTGLITANSDDDDVRLTRYNNAVFAEGLHARITNGVGGVMSATGDEGAGVRLGLGANGSMVSNDGLITAATWFGVDFSDLGVAEFGRLENTGTIRGVQGAFNGNDTADVVVNRGAMVGQIWLGSGADVYDGRGGRTEGLILGGEGTDLVDLRGAAMVNGDIFGGAGNDTIRGSEWDDALFGNDDVDVLLGYGGDDTLIGGLGAGQLSGGSGDDALYGGNVVDVLSGGEGHDTLDGGDGDTNAFGGNGDDYLIISAGLTARFITASGGAGDDTVIGGGGNNTVFGGLGDDVLSMLDGDDVVDGGDGADRLNLSDGADSAMGGLGDDTLSGDAGSDELSGNAGNDDMFGGNDADNLNGGFGDDDLSGDGGVDAINGASGNDTINGGAQRDVLAGGAGADVFVFTAVTDTGLTTATADWISDMRAGSDMIDLSAIDARSNVAGNQAFTFVGTGSLTGPSGQLRYDVATGLVQGDVNGDGVADFAIFVQNRAALAALDFVL
jgi:RTX calcium-binding nonapeptide repeat (4 copies)